MPNALRSLAIVLIVISIFSLAGCSSYPTFPAAGAPAPDFTLMNQDGKPVSLKDYRGQWVVLFFYPRDSGKRGTTGTHSFRRDQRKLEELHTVVLGISRDNVSTHKAFADQEQLHFPLLSDEGQKVPEQYGLFERTHIFFHLVVYSSFIVDPNGKIARVFPDFDPLDASSEVLKALNTVQHQ